jgi:hypothetical protein
MNDPTKPSTKITRAEKILCQAVASIQLWQWPDMHDQEMTFQEHANISHEAE